MRGKLPKTLEAGIEQLRKTSVRMGDSVCAEVFFCRLGMRQKISFRRGIYRKLRCVLPLCGAADPLAEYFNGVKMKKYKKTGKRNPLSREHSIEGDAVPRIHADIRQGLSEREVEERVRAGLVNRVTETPAKTTGQIIFGNIFTLFNLLNFALALLILLVGSYKNLLFMGVVISNTFIGIVQELRAKKTIEKLSLLSAPAAHAVRGGEKREIATDALVLDDILVLTAGNQVPADCIIREGEVEVDESILTGESVPLAKKPGEMLMSGSFLVAGTCRAAVEHVGDENYIAKLSKEAKRPRKTVSELMRSLNTIIKIVSFIIVPVGVLLFCNSYFFLDEPLDEAVVSAVAAMTGMIPEGLVLLTSVALAVGVVRLAGHKTLVQELYCMETLARVDTLCLDKTGTLTEGKMEVTAVIPIASGADVEGTMGNLLHACQDENATALALRERFPEKNDWKSVYAVPFSSARKWSAACFEGRGTYAFGAPDFILRDGYESIRGEVERHASTGARVLLLAGSPQRIEGQELPADMMPLAYLLLSDKIRPEAPEVLAYFKEQGVAVKVISGDNPLTVSEVASRAGLEGADRYVDAGTLLNEEMLEKAASEYTVFGRVTPEQKRVLIRSLKKAGHTVAMTGDGVNDVLALKDADCSIAMASGSDAARQVSQLVLLSSDFSNMPRVVDEGRRVINNIERASSLFLVKTLFSFILSLCFLFIPQGYPFMPIQLTLISVVTIGIPSFFLALEPNKKRISGSFLSHVFQKALPGAVTTVTGVLTAVFAGSALGLSDEQISTICVLAAGVSGLSVLLRVCLPFEWKRFCLFLGMVFLFILGIWIGAPLFSLVALPEGGMLLAGCICVGVYPFMAGIAWLLTRLRILKK